MAKIRNSKNKIFTSFAWIIALLILTAAIIINVIVAKLDFNIDVSVQKLFSLSKTSSEYLDKLDSEGKKIEMYFLTDMDELKNDSQTRSLYRAMIEYSQHECIDLIDFDPNKNEEMLEKINSDNTYTLSPGDIILVYGDNKRHINGISMYNEKMTYNSSGEIVESEEFFAGENIITSNIQAVVDGYLPTVYFLEGHGEKTMKDNYDGISSLMKSKNYRTKQLNLSESEAVPDDGEIVVIAAPTSDILPNELEKLSDYLDKGGSISIMLSPNGGKFDYNNLQKLLNPFCLEIGYDYIRETDSSSHIAGDDTTILCNLAEQEESSKLYADMASLIESDFYTYMPKSRSVEIDGDNENLSSVETGILINTNSSAVSEPYGGTYDNDVIEDRELPVAVYSEDKNRNNAKVTLFGNAEFIDDDHIQDVSYMSSYYVYLSTVTWMADQNLDMGIGEKSATEDYLSVSKSTAQTLVLFFIALPVVIMIIGVGIWLRRRHS
ncbi:MAG: Gldg family protein [Oscillospiraceae bacterium]|nr:Gldg family protein [Oscillospiraceae bacterium]